MNNGSPKLELEDWMPMEPAKGPPLPRLLNILWPWEKPAEIVVPTTTGEVIVVSPEEQQIQTQQEQEAQAAEEAFDLPKATMDPPWGMTHEQSIAMGYTEEELRTGIMEAGHADPLTQYVAELIGPLTPEEIAFWTRSLAEPGVALELYNAAALIGSVPGTWPMIHTTAPGFEPWIDEGISVMKACIREIARELKYEADEAEAIARGIPIEAIGWRNALFHVRSVEKVASMSYEEYKASTTYPDWYTERSKEMGYASQLAEAIQLGLAPLSSFTDQIQSGVFTNSMLMQAFMAGQLPKEFLAEELAKAPQAAGQIAEQQATEASQATAAAQAAAKAAAQQAAAAQAAAAAAATQAAAQAAAQEVLDAARSWNPYSKEAATSPESSAKEEAKSTIGYTDFGGGYGYSDITGPVTPYGWGW